MSNQSFPALFKCAVYGLCGYAYNDIKPWYIRIVEKDNGTEENVTLSNCPITSWLPTSEGSGDSEKWYAILTATVSSVDIKESYLGNFTENQNIFIRVYSKNENIMSEIEVAEPTELNNIQVGVSGLIEWGMGFEDISSQAEVQNGGE